MLPYIGVKLSKGLPVAYGCLGEIWTVLAEKLKINSRFMIYDEKKSADVVLQGATSQDPRAIQLAIVSSWYDIHLERSQVALIMLSYLKNWSPFHWYSTIAMVFLYMFALYVMLKIANKYFPVEKLRPVVNQRLTVNGNWRHSLLMNRQLRNRDEESFGNCAVASISVVCNQGSAVKSSIAPVRMLVLSFLIFGMIMTSSFSALLVSQLTAGGRGAVFPINAESMVLCVRHNSLPYQTNEIKRQHMVRSTCTFTVCDGYPVLETSEIFGHTRHPCTVVTLGQRQFQFQIAIGLMPNAPIGLPESLQLALTGMREKGLTSRVHKKWLKRPELFSTERYIHEITLSQVSGIFYTYFIMNIVSVAILLLEIFFNTHYCLFSNRA